VYIELAGTQCGEPCEDADDDFYDFFSRVLYNERNDMVMYCDADAMNVGYSYVQ